MGNVGEDHPRLSGNHPFHSSRLIYRAIDAEVDAAFFLRLQQSSLSVRTWAASLHTPRGPQRAEAFTKAQADSSTLLSAVVCLPRPRSEQSSTSTKDNLTVADETIPIGYLSLTLETPVSYRQHNRHASLGIIIVDQYQGQGYGSEAIRWGLQWAFDTAGLHRVLLSCFGWNANALKLYKRLGFVEEGISREHCWYQGRWWGQHELGMLEHEWRTMRDACDGWKPTA